MKKTFDPFHSDELFDLGTYIANETDAAKHNEIKAGIQKAAEALQSLTALTKEHDCHSSPAVLQALFKSGLYEEKSPSFFETEMKNYTLGCRMHSHLDNILALHSLLTERGFTGECEREKMAEGNTPDSYLAAFEFSESPDEDEIAVHNLTNQSLDETHSPLENKPVKVLYIERQSPAYAIIVRYCAFSLKPETMTAVRLKMDYSDYDHLPMLVNTQFKPALALSEYDNYPTAFYKLATCDLKNREIKFTGSEAELNGLMMGIGFLAESFGLTDGK